MQYKTVTFLALASSAMASPQLRQRQDSSDSVDVFVSRRPHCFRKFILTSSQELYRVRPLHRPADLAPRDCYHQPSGRFLDYRF